MTISDVLKNLGIAPGDILVGKYRVERVLGHGGMGVIFPRPLGNPYVASFENAPPPSPIAFDTSPTPPGQSQRTAGLVIAGIGIVGAAAGGILAVVAKSKDIAARDETFPAKHDDSLSDLAPC